MPMPKISVWEALRIARESGHGRLVSAARDRLKREGYRILSCEVGGADVSDEELHYNVAPKLGLSYGEVARHDVFAEKDGEIAIVEVAFAERIARQVAEAKKKANRIIIVMPIEDAEGVEVWGLRELKLAEAER